jgi:hypothetical protein
VTGSGGVVTLTGEVRSIPECDEVERAASSATGVVKVINRLLWGRGTLELPTPRAAERRLRYSFRMRAYQNIVVPVPDAKNLSDARWQPCCQ